MFTPDNEDPLFQVSAAGGEPVQITELNEERGENGHRLPHFLPDGEHFLFFARFPASSGPGQTAGTLMLGSIDGREPRPILELETNAVYASGHLLYIRDRILMAQPFDASKGETAGEAFPIAEEVEFHHWSSFDIFTASQNGVLAYQTASSEQAFRLSWHDRGGASAGTLGEEASYGRPSISPDGRHVAVAVLDAFSANWDVWVFETQRQIRTRFTNDDAIDGWPVWAPDGTEILFASRGSTAEGLNLFRKSFIRPEPPSTVLARDGSQRSFSWSPDGRHIAYGESGDIFVLALEEGAEPIPIATAPDFFERRPEFSADGRWLLFLSDETGQDELYVAPFPGPGRKWQISTSGVWDQGYFTREDREIVFLDRANRIVAVDVQIGADEMIISPPQPLFEVPGIIDSYAVSPDGEQFLLVMSPEEQTGRPLTLVVNWTAEIED